MALARENYSTGQKMNIPNILILCSITFARQFCFVLAIVIIFLCFILYFTWQERQSFLALKKKGLGEQTLKRSSIPEFVPLRLASLTCALRAVSLHCSCKYLIYLQLCPLVSQEPDFNLNTDVRLLLCQMEVL